MQVYEVKDGKVIMFINMSCRIMLFKVTDASSVLMCTVCVFPVSADVSGNEWKTRFETQVELNGQLERQISLIHERLEDLRGNPMGEFGFPH